MIRRSTWRPLAGPGPARLARAKLPSSVHGQTAATVLVAAAVASAAG